MVLFAIRPSRAALCVYDSADAIVAVDYVVIHVN